MLRYTRYYVNESGGSGEIGPVYRASFRVQRDNGIRSFSAGSFISLNLFCIQGKKAVGKEALKKGSHIITDILKK